MKNCTILENLAITSNVTEGTTVVISTPATNNVQSCTGDESYDDADRNVALGILNLTNNFAPESRNAHTINIFNDVPLHSA